MYNTIQNATEHILILDMRPTHLILRSHINFDLQNNSNLPLPSDLVMNLHDFSSIFENELLRKYELVNSKKIEKFKNKRRLYVFIVASENSDVDLGSMNSSSDDDDADRLSIKKALALIAQLKKERVFREVYLLRESHRSFENRYKFLMSSHIARFE